MLYTPRKSLSIHLLIAVFLTGSVVNGVCTGSPFERYSAYSEDVITYQSTTYGDGGSESDSHGIGTTATVTCKPLFKPLYVDDKTDTQQSQCQGDGSWSLKIRCVSCYDKDDCVGGEHVQGCTNNLCQCKDDTAESADNTYTKCRARTCPSYTVEKGTITPADASNEVGTTVTLECDTGYSAKGGDVTATCSGANFTYAPPLKCIICSKDGDCDPTSTTGVCNDGLCECKDNYESEIEGARICKEVTCPENYCGLHNNHPRGECYVEDGKRRCKCYENTAGDKCKQIISDACAPNPCKNGGTCGYANNNFAEYKCTCTGKYSGSTCEEIGGFYYKREQYAKVDNNAQQFSIKVTPAKTNQTMALLILMARAADVYERWMVYAKPDDCVGVYVGGKEETTLMCQKLKEKSVITVEGHSIFKVDGVTIFKAQNSGGLQIEKIILGGCSYDDMSQPCYPMSKLAYVPFVGYFNDFSVNGDPYDTSKLPEDGLEFGARTCENYKCKNSGTCKVEEGRISCECPTGLTGLDCNFVAEATFDGVDTDVQSSANIPVLPDKQTLRLSVETNDNNAMIGNFTLKKCSVSLALNNSGGNVVLMMSTGVSSSEVSKTASKEIVLEFMTDTVKLIYNGTERVGTCSHGIDTTPIITFHAQLGGIKEAGSASFVGCIRDASVNGVHLMKMSDRNVDIGKCQAKANPCDSSPCKNNFPCDPGRDFKGVCACKEPFIGDATCELQDYCKVDTPCTTKDTEASCAKLDSDPYYKCTCSPGYTGDMCIQEKVVNKESDNTTVIIIIVVVVAVLVVVIVIVVVMKQRQQPTANGDAKGNTRGNYSPQSAELEMGKRAEKNESLPPPPEGNLYDNNVIENVNAESPADEAAVTVLEIPENKDTLSTI